MTDHQLAAKPTCPACGANLGAAFDTCREHAPNVGDPVLAGWSAREVREFHRLIQCVRAAHVETDLRNMRLLRIEPDHSGDPTRARATLSSGRVIDLTFKTSDNHGAVVFGVLTAEMEPQR